MPKRIVLAFWSASLTLNLSMSSLDAAELFYQGKTLRVIVASAAGGGSDIVARLMMRHLSRHIPGNPTIIIENMPGAGEIIGVNYVHNRAKPDGSLRCLPREHQSRNSWSFRGLNSIC